MKKATGIQNATPLQTNGYVTFNSQNKANILASNNVLESYTSINKAADRTVATLEDYTTTRSPFDKREFNRQRPCDMSPSSFNDVILSCRAAYLKVGVIRNVVDLMTDFACEDIRFLHPDKKTEAFFKVWAAKTKLYDAIEEFVKHLLIDTNVVVKRITAKLTKPVETQWMSKVMADADEKLYTERKELETREIPWRYNFLNITALEWIGGEEAKALGTRQLGFRLSNSLLTSLKSNNDQFNRLLTGVPEGNLAALRGNKSNLVPLDMSKIYVCHGKKDSWEDWAPPFLYSILGDIRYKDKLKQAEMSALDGWINVIRIWKLGDHTKDIMAGPGALEKLANILSNNTGGGTMDLIWDSLIDMEEFYPPVAEIFGPDKFQQVNSDILIGLGVPDVLLGGAGANFSNSFIQLKTIIERLKYVRRKIKEWLYEEVHILCDAMDIPVAPKIRFSEINLEDEGTTRKLVVGLLDRGVISVEAVLQAYGQDFLVEVERIRQESTLLKENKIKVKSPLDPKPTPAKPGANGRPAAVKDSSKRKTRVAKPRRTASQDLAVFAMDTIHAIEEYIIPDCMSLMKVSNARKLTTEQKEEINSIRASILSCIKPGDDISRESLTTIAQDLPVNKSLLAKICQAVNNYAGKNGTAPTVGQRRMIESVTWANFYSDN